MTFICWVSSKRINCPIECKCDRSSDLRRVTCTKQNLLNIGDDIPQEVEILDISYNQISELFKNEFRNLGFKSIKSLNISHNKIGHMHLNAFKGLNKIKVIDLSYNVIEYILLEWFVDLPNLKQLYMNNNNFFKMKASNPLMSSKSLEILDVSNCKLTQVSSISFSKVPKLKSLKLDGNFLIEISPNVIKPLKNLDTFSANDNPFNCGKVMNDLKQYTRGNIRYVDPCTKTKISNLERSQKMIVLDEQPMQYTEWMYEEESTDKNTPFCNCTKFNYEAKGLLLEIIELSPIISVVVTLVTGFTLGLIVACSVQITPSKASAQRRPRRYSIIRRTYLENADPLVLDCENVFESTPLTSRKIEMYPLR
ncbi:hypothetical protein Trydic_g9125 [Trypoxylus dichotomus]